MTEFKNIEKVEGFQLICGYLGYVFILVGFIILLPLLVLPFYPKEIELAKFFVIPGVGSIITGYLFSLIIKGKEKGKLHKNQDAIIVVFSWIIAIVVSALPFVLTGKYNFTQAIFETTSGYSTTGLSVVDVASCSHIFLLFRSIILFFGGIGLVLVMTSAMSDAHGMRLYTAEGHSDKLMPNLIKSARMIIVIYAGYILAGTILYTIFGMPVFDALNHSIASVSTGGFSTQADSIGAYNSIEIETITIILMLLGGTNFFVHLLLLKGKFKSVLKHCETKLWIIMLAVFVPIMAFILSNGAYKALPHSFREAVFQAVSAFTTTGFQTVPTFKTWPSSLMFIMIILMLIGGGAGSTAGGMKQYRVAFVFKAMYISIKNQIMHTRTITVDKINRYGKQEKMDKSIQISVIIYLCIYLVIFFLGSFIFCLFGYSLEHSMFEFSSALSTVGLSVGITGYNAHPVLLWTGTIGMFVGRLEIYVVFLAISRIFLDTKNKAVQIYENSKKRI